MSDPSDELAVPPAEQLLIVRAETTGWYVRHDTTIVACFTNARELAAWIEDICSPLDPQQPREAMPSALNPTVDGPRARRSIWSVIAGGKRDS